MPIGQLLHAAAKACLWDCMCLLLGETSSHEQLMLAPFGDGPLRLQATFPHYRPLATCNVAQPCTPVTSLNLHPERKVHLLIVQKD